MRIRNLTLLIAVSKATGAYSWCGRTQAHSLQRMAAYGWPTTQQRHFSRKSVWDFVQSATSKGFGTVPKEEVDPGAVEGTNLRILKYPHPKLREENEIVTEFDESLKQIANEMLLVMYAAEGVGLAAPQVGINKRLMVFNEDGDPTAKHKEMVLVNPVIVAKSNKTVVTEEGCLSFPKIYGDVTRARWIAVDYQTLEGKQVKNYYLEGNDAIIFQHEYDHLDKILFIDHISEDDRIKIARQLDKLIAKFGPGGSL